MKASARVKIKHIANVESPYQYDSLLCSLYIKVKETKCPSNTSPFDQTHKRFCQGSDVILNMKLLTHEVNFETMRLLRLDLSSLNLYFGPSVDHPHFDYTI